MHVSHLDEDKVREFVGSYRAGRAKAVAIGETPSGTDDFVIVEAIKLDLEAGHSTQEIASASGVPGHIVNQVQIEYANL